MSNENNAQENNAAVGWFFGAGLVAVLLCISLYQVDEMLTHSKKEQILGETLRELRGAQFSIPSHGVDERLNPDTERRHW